MGKQICIVKNISRETPGLFEIVLHEKGIPSTIVDLEKGEALPDPKKYAAVMVLGGYDSANDNSEKIRTELKWIDQVLNANIPYFGVCLGMQLLVKAAGGSVIKNTMPEWGTRDNQGNCFYVELTQAGKDDALMKNLTDKLPVFHMHEETIELTKTMQLLARGKCCKNQTVKINDHSYGVQGHFEITTDLLTILTAHDQHLAKMKSVVHADFKNMQNKYEQTGRTLFTNFLHIAHLV